MTSNPFAGKWTYRSLLNHPGLSRDFDKLESGRGIAPALGGVSPETRRGSLSPHSGFAGVFDLDLEPKRVHTSVNAARMSACATI